MKKPIAIILGVLALIALTHWADRRWPANGRAGSTVAASDSDVYKNVVFKDLQDQDLKLDQYMGKVVLVNFWATWCDPCKIETPWLIEFQQKYASRGFTIVGVSMDSEGKKIVDPYVTNARFDVNGQQEAFNYPIVIGSDAIADKFGGVIGMPTSFLYDRQGRLVKTIVGLESKDDLEKAIADQLK